MYMLSVVVAVIRLQGNGGSAIIVSGWGTGAEHCATIQSSYTCRSSDLLDLLTKSQRREVWDWTGEGGAVVENAHFKFANSLW